MRSLKEKNSVRSPVSRYSKYVRRTFSLERENYSRYLLNTYFMNLVNLVITLSQSAPFPEGNYKLLYTVHDEPSGNAFEMTKDITISASPTI
jgi:hypothetical protein